MHYLEGINAVAFAPDGSAVLLGCEDKTARLCDPVTGKTLGKPLDEGWVRAVAFSPDGHTFHAASGSRIRAWDVRTRLPNGLEIVFPPDPVSGVTRSVNVVAFGPAGKTIVAIARDSAMLWEAATGRPIGGELGGQMNLSPTGVALGGIEGPSARIWDATTGNPIGKPLEHGIDIAMADFSADGKVLVTVDRKGNARFWDTTTGRPLGEPLRHSGEVAGVALSRDGKAALTISDGVVSFWDVATGRPIGAPLDLPDGAEVAAFSPDGTTILADGRCPLAWLWDITAPSGGVGEDEAKRLVLWVKAATGMEIDENGSVRLLDGPAWDRYRQDLAKVGGAP